MGLQCLDVVERCEWASYLVPHSVQYVGCASPVIEGARTMEWIAFPMDVLCGNLIPNCRAFGLGLARLGRLQGNAAAGDNCHPVQGG